MALSRELLKRLNSSDDYPLPKRLKLAETVFFAVDLPLVRKEDLLLEWLCKICTTNRYAWKTLNNCLKSSNFNVNINVKQCLIDTLMQALNSDLNDIYEEVLECCSLVLANNTMWQYFTNKPKNLGLLIKTLLNNVLERSNSRNVEQEEPTQLLEPCKLSPVENYSIISIIESLMQIYRQSMTAKDELQLIFIHDILYPMCNLIDHKHIDITNKFGIAAYKCIQQLLLGKSRSIQNRQTTESSQATFSELFHTLSENVKTLDLQSNLLTYQFTFRAVIGTYKSDAALLDTFFRKLINSSGRYKWEILNAFLKLLNDIILDFDNDIEDITLSEYLQKIISDMLTYKSLTYVQYEILTQLSYINPLLIEKNILDILNKILMEEQTADYTNLLIAVLHSSTKLRREQKFISQLLISLKQHIAIKEAYETNTSAFFPYEFRIKLTKVVRNFSNSQTNATLRTLIHHLNTDCVELLQCNVSCKNVLILKATVELLVILFEGIQIFEYTRMLSIEKFINDLDELGNVLSLLIDKALCLSHNKTVIMTLLNAVQSLSEIQDMLKYYLPKDAYTNKLLFPILDNPWQQLIQRITNFGEDNCKNIMNKLILHRIKINTSNKSIKLHGLIGGIEYAWSTILKHDTDILLLLHDKEISKITYLLLDNITSGKEDFSEWLDILDKECLQENRRFVMYLLSHILDQIGQCLPVECTDSITKCINGKLLLENELNDKLLEVSQVIKEQISQEQLVQMANAFSLKIELYLEILLHLPTIYFNPNVRVLIFLVVYFISKKCEKNDKVSALCNVIFSDLLEKTGIDIFQYIEPTMLINQLSENKAFLKACEFSLRNAKTYATLKSLIKRCKQCKKTMCIILECIEIIKLKVDIEQKVIFKKAEKRLVKSILKVLHEEINDALDVRCLTAVLKVTILTGEVTDSLKNLTELTLKNIFIASEDSSDTSNSLLLQQSIQLIIITLRHRQVFKIEDTNIKNLWFIMFKYPCQYLLEPLLASTGLKELHELLRLLYDKTIKSLSETDEVAWANLLVIWSGIMKTNMSVKRNKMRLIAINHLFETVLLLDIPDKCWSGLLRLSHDIIGAKYLLIPDIMVDLIILISLRSLVKVKISSCENVLLICRTLIKVKTDLITDRLPNFLLLYRNMINVIVHASKCIADKFEEHRFKRLAFDIEKLTSLLVKLKKDMMRLSPYVIADFMQFIVEGTIPSYMKMALYNSLYQLLSICDQHGITFLSRTLPASLQEVFKVQLNMFNKFYKYSGKI